MPSGLTGREVPPRGEWPLHTHPLAPGAPQIQRPHSWFSAQPSEEETGAGSQGKAGLGGAARAPDAEFLLAILEKSRRGLEGPVEGA